MQEIITWLVILIAVVVLGIKTFKSAKTFKKRDNSCNGCGSSCDGCPIAPGNKKEREK